MRRSLLIGIIIAITFTLAAAPVFAAKGDCTTLQEGVIKYSPGHFLAGQAIPVGYDAYGYNYQAHMFSGSYYNVYSGGAGFPAWEGDDAAYLAANPAAASNWAWPYRETNLVMKWNDAWISNKDCNGDGKLDRHYGYATYRGSGAWETNHMNGTYEQDGKKCKWTDFVKIVAAPADAVKTGGTWYTAEGSEIGPDIWGEFAIIQEVYNDPCAGYNGVLYKSPTSAGFGYYGPQLP